MSSLQDTVEESDGMMSSLQDTVEESDDKMSSLQDTLNSLNRKLEKLKQGAGAREVLLEPTKERMVEVKVTDQLVDLARREETTASLPSHMAAHNSLAPAERPQTEMVKHDLLPAAVQSDNEVEDSQPEQTTKLNIFSSSDLALTDFMLEEEEEAGTEGGGDVKESPNMLIPTVVPAGSEAENSLKSRRRKLFRGHSKLQLSTSKPSAAREEQSEGQATKSKLEPSNKFKLRKLFRNSDRNEITIVEKPNPRKIIFRKGLVRGQRRKVGSGKKNDSLVASLQKQIRTQSNRLFTKRKPFPAKAPTSTTTATTTTTEEVRNTEDV